MFLRHGLKSVAFAAVLALAACQKPADPAATEPVAAAAPAAASAATPAATTETVAGPGKSCGGVVGDQVCETDKTTYCKKATDPARPGAQCVPGTIGVCTPKPQICPEVEDPVCGCDGQRYGNACKAERAGVNVASRGECKKPT